MIRGIWQFRPFFDPDTGANPATSSPTEASQADAAAQAPAQEAASSSPATSDMDALKKELAEARREAAKYRTERKQTETAALTEAGNFKSLYEQSQAALTALQAEATQREREQLLRKVAKDAALSEDLIDRLRGDDEASLLADAKLLAKRFTPIPPSTGASNPGAKREGESEDEQISKLFAKRPGSGMRW